jgi:hypothetical protein
MFRQEQSFAETIVEEDFGFIVAFASDFAL